MPTAPRSPRNAGPRSRRQGMWATLSFRQARRCGLSGAEQLKGAEPDCPQVHTLGVALLHRVEVFRGARGLIEDGGADVEIAPRFFDVRCGISALGVLVAGDHEPWLQGGYLVEGTVPGVQPAVSALSEVLVHVVVDDVTGYDQ